MFHICKKSRVKKFLLSNDSTSILPEHWRKLSLSYSELCKEISNLTNIKNLNKEQQELLTSQKTFLEETENLGNDLIEEYKKNTKKDLDTTAVLEQVALLNNTVFFNNQLLKNILSSDVQLDVRDNDNEATIITIHQSSLIKVNNGDTLSNHVLLLQKNFYQISEQEDYISTLRWGHFLNAFGSVLTGSGLVSGVMGVIITTPMVAEICESLGMGISLAAIGWIIRTYGKGVTEGPIEKKQFNLATQVQTMFTKKPENTQDEVVIELNTLRS